MRGCATQLGYFLTKNPYAWVPFWSKKILREGPISLKIAKKKKKKKNVKSAGFEAEKLLEMGLDLQKFQKDCLISHFWSEKNP